ncbi:MAG TPA: peptidylprolyl isomerase [Kofleriaceae bacterium]|nr:peptidylprolyl isomerase [Kofleriaceae bacterium]
MKLHRSVVAALAATLALAGCEKKPSKFVPPAHTPAGGDSHLPGDQPVGQQGSGHDTVLAPPATPTTPAIDIDSKDILDRTETAKAVFVKHVFLAWKDLESVYGPQMDPRAKGRDNAAAAALAKELADKLRAAPDQIDALVKEHSEDPGSKGGDPYEVKEATQFVPEFKKLALRLKENEVGIVKTQFGYHVIERVAPPKPDPLEPADILAREPETAVRVQHVLIGWKDVPAAAQRPVDDRAKTRTKADADKVASEILAKVKAGGDMAALMKEFSEDPGTKDTGKDYEINENTPFVEPFKNLSLRLKIGEAGMIRSPFGWHVIKRMAPPPPDALESADILKRAPVTKVAKVKHILLSDEKTNSAGGDPRGKKRTRAELEALVKKTVAALNAKGKIEPLMAELSEDPGSAKSGTSYDVTPEAGLVEPFKALSLRLNVGETGVVKTDFGFHIIQRTE